VNILMTGVTGRIGANVARRLLDRGHAIRGLVWEGDRRADKVAALGVAVLEGNLNSSTDISAAVRGQDAIIHLGAAFQAGGPFTPEQYFDTNVKGTFNVLEAALGLGDRLRHLFFASTDATLDKYPPDGNPTPLTETSLPQSQTGWYAFSKILGERLVDRYLRAERLPVTVFRFPVVWGAGEVLDWPQFRLQHFLARFRSRTDPDGRATFERLTAADDGRERLLIACDGNGRPWKKHSVDVRDLAQAFEAALGNDATFGRTYQLAGPAPFTWDDAVPHLAEVLGLTHVRADLAGIPPTFYEYDLSASRRDFGFDPQFDIHAMIDEAARYRTAGSDAIVPT
jgi:UDP-glucose 4-epimerase